MTLRLTPDMIAAAYEFFRQSRPFKAMRLPEADHIIFVVNREPYGTGYVTNEHRKRHEISLGISEKTVGSTFRLMECVSHEMIHVYQTIRRTDTGNTQHNAQFWKIAARVCKEHGFDPKAFV